MRCMMPCHYTARLGIVVLFVLLFSACAPKPHIDVVERKTVSTLDEIEKIGGRLIRIVKPGDTLYSIAFAHGLNVNDLAQWNSITDTGRLLVGQRIRLSKPIGFNVKKPVVVERVVVQSNARVKPNVSPSAGTTVKKSVIKKTPDKKAVKKVAPKVFASNRAIKKTNVWYWPVTGSVIEKFSIAKGQQGIAISSGLSKPVVASKAGEVVYVGNALKGYGNLIIIKHSEHFLSAYAHNQRSLVVEGQMVTVKQVIGAVGLDNKRRPALHFQIRKDGKPVNPLLYLKSS